MISALHPALVHFPIALIIFSVICEFIGRFRQSAFARTAAWWSLVGAVISGALAVAAGYYDMFHANLQPRTHELVDQHMMIGWALVAGLLLLTAWRWAVRRNPVRHAGPAYLLCALLLIGVTTFQGWYGGEMAYAFGAGVPAAGQGQVDPQKAQENLQKVEQSLDRLSGLAISREEGEIHGEHHH